MLAITFGVPPIAPAHPGVLASLPAELHDLLYEPNNADDFAAKIDYALKMSSAEYQVMRDVCRQFAQLNAPEKISTMLETEIMERIN
jgi:glycosyltransferase involved in cell wall biosynthesis